MGCIFEKKEERDTAAPIDAQVAQATLKLSRSAKQAAIQAASIFWPSWGVYISPDEQL